MTFPGVSIVIIGRNEAENLAACIQSTRALDYPKDKIEVLYVDTDSTDASPEIARALGVKVFEEHSDFPSPGRARNRGWQEATHEIVHFIDGDMTLASGYIREAVKYLDKKSVICVFGFLNELRKQENFISRVLHYSWETKSSGYVDAPGAGGTFLKSALTEVRGYNPDMLRGEETEIGFRLRERGYRILMLDQPMGTHDYSITTTGALFQRFYNTGRSLGKVLLLDPSPSLAPEQRAARRNVIQCLVAVIVTVVLCIMGWWWILICLPFLVALYVVVKYWGSPMRRGLRVPYFLLEYWGKPVLWVGMAVFLGKQAAISFRIQPHRV